MTENPSNSPNLSQNSSSPTSAPRPEFNLGPTQFGPAQLSLAVQTTHAGPLPPPAMLAAFGEIDPSFPNRIVAMAEKNAETERTTATRAQIFQFYDAMAGRVLGFVFAAGGLAVAFTLAMHGHDAVASVIGGTVIAGAAAALIRGKAP